MDMDDERYNEVIRATGSSAASLLEVLDEPEVREALLEWASKSFDLIRAMERAGLARHAIAGMMGGSVIDALQKMNEE